MSRRAADTVVMRDYTGYSVEDLMDDPWFREWVNGPSEKSAAFWEQWIATHPEQFTTIGTARKLLLTVNKSFGDEPGDDQKSREGLQKLHWALDYQAENDSLSVKFNWWKLWTRIAAVLVLVTGLGWWLSEKYGTGSAQVAYRISKNDEHSKRVTNTGKSPKSVFLNDGSVAVLEPGTSIRFHERFNGKTRVVYLEGEAFFDVAKDTTRPFLVYAEETVTRVTGTSFRISALPAVNSVSVAVKTGSVSVYTSDGYLNSDRQVSSATKVVHLVPNEQAVFNRREQRLSKTTVPRNYKIGAAADEQETVFEDQSVSKVLTTISRHYNVQILFDERALSDCKITTGFTQETLRQRLAIICETIDADYTFRNGAVRITGASCGKTEEASPSNPKADHDE